MNSDNSAKITAFNRGSCLAEVKFILDDFPECHLSLDEKITNPNDLIDQVI